MFWNVVLIRGDKPVVKMLAADGGYNLSHKNGVSHEVSDVVLNCQIGLKWDKSETFKISFQYTPKCTEN